MKRNYETLDAIVVVGSLTIVGGGCLALALLRIPSENLAVLAGLLGTIAGTILGGYAGFRWGASVAQKSDKGSVVVEPPHGRVTVEENNVDNPDQ